MPFLTLIQVGSFTLLFSVLKRVAAGGPVGGYMDRTPAFQPQTIAKLAHS
jgi:hypothetical protein